MAQEIDLETRLSIVAVERSTINEQFELLAQAFEYLVGIVDL